MTKMDPNDHPDPFLDPDDHSDPKHCCVNE